MESSEEVSSTENFSPEEVNVAAKTLLMQCIALNNLEGFSIAVEALGELHVGFNWSCHSNSVLFSHGNQWNTPLTFAAKLGRLSMVSTLIEKGADPNMRSHFELGKSVGFTALHEASKSGQLQIVDYLLTHGSNVNGLDSRGWTPIHNAICENNIDIAMKLLCNGADPRQTFKISISDMKNFTVIGRSSIMSSTEPDKLYVSKPSFYEWNCLTFAANCHQPDLVHKLVHDFFQEDVDFRNMFGRTALHEAAILPEALNLDKEILIQQRHKTLEVLLKAGVNPNIQDNAGKTVLHHFFDHANLAKVVVRKYPKIVASLVSLLCDYRANLNVADFSGRTLAHQAAALGDSDMMKLLLEKGACFLNQDNDGNAPAHIAALHGKFKVLQYLLEQAPHADLKNFHGDTVLHVAIKTNGNEDALIKIAQTLKSGVDPKMNVYGETEYDMALKFNLKRLSSLLSQMHKMHSANCASGRLSEEVNVNLKDTTDKGDHCQAVCNENVHSDIDTKNFAQEHDPKVKSCNESDGNADVPELLIKEGTDVNAYLLRLCNEYRVKHLHMDSKEDCHERCTVAKNTVTFIQKILDLVAEDDERFSCEVLCTGSAFEGYRIGKPDEFDYMGELKSLSQDSCEILETETQGFVRVRVKNEFRGKWKMFLSEDGFLDALKVKCCLANALHSKAKEPCLIHRAWRLDFNTTSYDSCELCQPFVCTSKAGIKMTLFWRGSLYKFMPIDIDVTPAIHFPNWPKAARVPPLHVLEGYADLGYHVVPKSGGNDSLLWRLSFSVAELKILQNVSALQAACYTSLKIIKEQTMLRSPSQRFSHLGFLHTYVLKTKFFEELDRYKDAEFWSEEKLVDRVCSVLESTASLLSQRGASQVESYFLPGFNIIGKKDRDVGIFVAASMKTTLHNVVKLLRKELDLSLETEPRDDEGFTMNFELDSDHGSDDCIMRFEDPAT